MRDLTERANETLARQHGVIAVRQLRAADVSSTTWRRLLRAGVLVEVHRGVFRSTSHPRTLEQRCVELSLAHPRGFVTGPTGGVLVNLRRMPSTSALHFAVAHGARVDPVVGVRFRQTTKMAPFDVDVRLDGIRVASARRLAFDLAADLGDLDHRSVVEQLLHERRCTMDELVEVGRRLGHPGRRGTRRFLATLDARCGPPVESHAELRVADALRARGVPVVAQTTWLALPDGARARLDLSVPHLKWGVEVDVHPHHLGLDGTTGDKRRDRQCHLIGWEIERVTAIDMEHFASTIDELVLLFHRRQRALAG